MLWGPLSDRYGRRPIFIICLIVLTGSCIGLALCPTNGYWLLLVLRCLQASGCSSTIALGMGVIGDISEPEERGGFVGIFNLGPMVCVTLNSPCHPAEIFPACPVHWTCHRRRSLRTSRVEIHLLVSRHNGYRMPLFHFPVLSRDHGIRTIF